MEYGNPGSRHESVQLSNQGCSLFPRRLPLLHPLEEMGVVGEGRQVSQSQWEPFYKSHDPFQAGEHNHGVTFFFFIRAMILLRQASNPHG